MIDKRDMTVRQLIDRLNELIAAGLPESATVVTEGCDCWGTVRRVEPEGDIVSLYRDE